MTNEEIRALGLEDLAGAIEDEKERLQRLRISNAVTPLENPMQIRQKRRQIARLMTEMGRRTREEQQTTES
ncbi:MAG: 50S ribosomal protein L29 [Bacteroidota bacterium]